MIYKHWQNIIGIEFLPYAPKAAQEESESELNADGANSNN
jgi:hypothetical protein